MFYTNEPVYCPVCKPRYRKSKPDERCGVQLECTCHNYSGCAVDFAECIVCGGQFVVSYEPVVTKREDW